MFILPWKLLFLFILMTGSFIAMSSSSWFMAWIGLEINMLALMALFMTGSSSRNSEASLKYFLVQALASAIFISSALTTSNLFSFLSSYSIFSSFIAMSLLLKLGAAPFHMWVPQIMEGLSWVNNTILLSWQKVAPFFLFVSCLESKISSSMLIFSIVLSSMLGALLGLSQNSTRKILAFSSINHLGWMLSAIWLNVSLWIFYFVSYCLILIPLILILNANNISNLSNTQTISSLSQSSLIVSLLSFGGLPPLFGFIPKWIVIQSIVYSSFSILLILVFSSLITLFFYSRIFFSSALKNSLLMKPLNNQSKISALIMCLNLSGLLIFPILFLAI